VGLPEPEVRAAAEASEAAGAEPPLRWFEFCRKYVAGRWCTAAAKTREGMADGLAAVTLAMVKRGDGTPEDESLRLAFRWGIVPANEVNEGRVFGNERGGLVGSSTYWRVWEEAGEYALPPERIDSPLAGRPYDLRHACITR
jgi:hypothetical protein